MAQKIYYYHYQTGEYFGEGFAEQSPLDPPGTWLIPMFATTTEPPAFDPATELCVFANGAWLVSPIPMPQPVPPKEPVVDPAVMAKQKQKDDAIKDAKNAALSLNTRIDAILQLIDAK